MTPTTVVSRLESFTRSFVAIDYFPGFVLLVAACAKGQNLPLFAKTFTTLFGIPQPQALLMSAGTFAAEMTLGSLLLVRPGDSFVRRVSAALFVGFAVVQVFRIAFSSGNPCGCFGLLQGAAYLRLFSNPATALATNVGLAAVLVSSDLIGFAINFRSNHRPNQQQ